MTDWLKAAQSQKEEYLNDLTTLIKIPSVRNDDEATPEYPLGPAPSLALKTFLEMAEQDGFRVKNIDNVAGFAEWGEGDQTLAILAHLDVMPAGKGWETDPFDPVIKDGNLYGRGVSDDKGPGMAAYYALKYLKDHGAVFKQKVRFIVGTDEENDWTGMKRYFEVEPAPTYGFSPDAEFPLINGEKGQVSLLLDIDGGNDGEVILKRFDSGLRFNMVPRDAEAVIEAADNEAIATAFTDFLDENPITGSMETDSEGIKLIVVGKAAHGMEPEKGINAGTYLATFLKQLDIRGHAGDFIDFAASYLHLDTRVNNFNAAFATDKMGEMTMNAGILKFDQHDGGHIDMNFRYPEGITADEILNRIKPVAQNHNFAISRNQGEVPHYVDADDPIVTTLLKAYIDQTGDQTAQAEVVGGGTYGRLMSRGVAFGALMPDTPNTMHQPNEFQPVDDLIKSMAIYMQAIHDLVVE